jgi:ATP-dependent helicase HrpA
MLVDRPGLRRQLHGLERRRRGGQPFDQGLQRLQQQIERSRALAQRRAALLPDVELPAGLPISEHGQEIRQLIDAHQVVVLCGETGSGKSTQLPKICLAMGRGVHGRIGHTQPRRIAARALAARISAELGRELGSAVGYKVRFHDRVGADSHVKLMTDGILLAEVQQDRWLNEYDTLIIDEAHERSLNIDFLIGYLKKLLPRRPEMKLIITSATIDPQRFSSHFDGAPVVNVSGRTYPVEVRYRPPAEDGGSERDDAVQQAILDGVDELSRIDRGDILVFLSGEREIRETAESLRKHKLELTEVLPLYARLGPSEQAAIFKPGGLRRVILATNVAETSLTVPGIRYVIDSGFARISRYSHRSKVQRLPVERISRASANQRKGRCGRVAAGVCLRLYSEEDFEARREFTEPEILRTNLASVILQMKILGFGDIEDFPFVDAPDSRMIKDGYRVLEEIGAVAGNGAVTGLGKKLARLPVDPRIGRMLLAAAETHCLNEMLVIAAALSVQDPRDRPMEKQQAADEAHHSFRDEQSDFLGYLKLWSNLEEQRHHLSRRKYQSYCRDNFLSWQRVQEWRDIHHQLRGQMHAMGYRENQAEAGYEAIHRALLSGLIGNIGCKEKSRGREYLGARNSRFLLFPGSGLFEKQPKWVLAAELVETSRLYARTLATIRPEWVEAVARHLVKRGYSEPHWEKNSGQVAAYERVTLFGLTLVPRRKVNYGPINPVEAREIFIRFALVGGDFHTRAPFWRHNRELLEYVEDLEHKSRRRDLLVDEEWLYQYYDRRIPEQVCNTPAFEKWLRQTSVNKPKLLHMRLQDLICGQGQVDSGQFPDELEFNGMRLPLTYRFDPGHEADGVTLKIPLTVLNQISDARCEWLVPGLLRERVIALLRSLPKSLRKSFVPVPEYADACLAALEPSDTPLTRALAEQLKTMTGVYIPEDAWQQTAIPEHLQMHYLLLGDNGRRVDGSRSLIDLQRRYGASGREDFHRLPDTGLEQDGLTGWDFGVLPETVDLQRGGIRLIGFPAILDRGQSVAIRVLDSADNAQQATVAGLRRLVMLRLSDDMRYLRRNLSGMDKLTLQYAKAAAPPEGLKLTGKPDLENQVVGLIVDLTFILDQPQIRNADAFERRIIERKGLLMTRAAEVLELVAGILGHYHPLRKSLAGATQINWMDSLADMRQQLDRLVFRGFLETTDFQQLRQLPRYLRAIALRLDKLHHQALRDRQRMRQMEPLYRQWQERDRQSRENGRTDPRLDELRWLFEELRVSLFAQELGTAQPVSLKRLEKRWKELGL